MRSACAGRLRKPSPGGCKPGVLAWPGSARRKSADGGWCSAEGGEARWLRRWPGTSANEAMASGGMGAPWMLFMADLSLLPKI
jgi:hypothetical protein